MNYLKSINELSEFTEVEKEKYEGIIGDCILDLLDNNKAIILVNRYRGFKIIISLNKIEFNSNDSNINDFVTGIRDNNLRYEKVISALPRIEKIGKITHIDVSSSSLVIIGTITI